MGRGYSAAMGGQGIYALRVGVIRVLARSVPQHEQPSVGFHLRVLGTWLRAAERGVDPGRRRHADHADVRLGRVQARGQVLAGLKQLLTVGEIGAGVAAPTTDFA